MPFSLGIFNQNNGVSSTPADEEAWRAVNDSSTVRTVQVVRGFRKVNQRELDRAQKEYEQMQAYIRIFEKWLDIMLKREKLDVEATKILNNYHAGVAQTLTEKRAAVTVKAIALQQQRLPVSQQQLQLQSTTRNVDAQIKQLRQQQNELAKSQGWA